MTSSLNTVATQLPGTVHAEIRRILLQRQRELLNDIQRKMHDVRDEGADRHHQVTDPSETTEADPEDDLAFALLQMKTQLLHRLEDAVRHIDEGTYGICVDCCEPIASSRLRALPFAVRCKDCQELREVTDHACHQSRRVASGSSLNQRLLA